MSRAGSFCQSKAGAFLQSRAGARGGRKVEQPTGELTLAGQPYGSGLFIANYPNDIHTYTTGYVQGLWNAGRSALLASVIAADPVLNIPESVTQFRTFGASVGGGINFHDSVTGCDMEIGRGLALFAIPSDLSTFSQFKVVVTAISANAFWIITDHLYGSELELFGPSFVPAAVAGSSGVHNETWSATQDVVIGGPFLIGDPATRKWSSWLPYFGGEPINLFAKYSDFSQGAPEGEVLSQIYSIDLIDQWAGKTVGLAIGLETELKNTFTYTEPEPGFNYARIAPIARFHKSVNVSIVLMA